MSVKDNVIGLLKSTGERDPNILFYKYLEKYNMVKFLSATEVPPKPSSIIRAIYKYKDEVDYKGLEINYNVALMSKTIPLRDVVEHAIQYKKKIDYNYVRKYTGLTREEYNNFLQINKDQLLETKIIDKIVEVSQDEDTVSLE